MSPPRSFQIYFISIYISQLANIHVLCRDDDEKARLKQQDAEDEKLEQEEKGEDEADSDGELEVEA